MAAVNDTRNIPPDDDDGGSVDQPAGDTATASIAANGVHDDKSDRDGPSDQPSNRTSDSPENGTSPNGSRSTDEIDNTCMSLPSGVLHNLPSSSSDLAIATLFASSSSKSQSNANSSIASTIVADAVAPLQHSSEIPNATPTNLDQFQSFTTHQCLCSVRKRTLQHMFENRYYSDTSDQRHVAMLSEWPVQQLIEYLSNVQLLTDVYLRQNTKGRICSRIMDIFNLIERDDTVMEELFKLGVNNNKFVQFLAGRVIANCFVIAKDNQMVHEGWLTLLSAGLNVNCVPLTNAIYIDYIGLRKINFLLEIVLRILEWRDDDEVLEESAEVEQEMAMSVEQRSTSAGRYADIQDDNFTLPVIVPPIQSNYFAMPHGDDSEDRPIPVHEGTAETSSMQESVTANTNIASDADSSCQYQYLADSESFDTQALKSNIVTSLKCDWSRLVERMIAVVHRLHEHNELRNAESTIITFLTLWERIISIQANLSVDSTLPFHEELSLVMKKLLIEITLPTAIYKQLLTLLNESLCYGTTLALQSDLPIENNTLANDIFNKVKNQQIFASMPVVAGSTQRSTENVTYTVRRRTTSPSSVAQTTHPGAALSSQSIEDQPKSMNRTLHQKLVLLILKSIAVTVKVLRNDDSSDSSMDGYSSSNSNDLEAYQEALQIERATRDVLKKLKRFMRTSLNHHPETHFSKMLILLFSDQDEYLIESMLCTLDITTVFLARQPNSDQHGTTVSTPPREQLTALLGILSPVYAFLEFLRLIECKVEFLLDLLVSSETCFLLYLLRFLKYVRKDWSSFCEKCHNWPTISGAATDRPNHIDSGNGRDAELPVLDRTVSILIELRKLIERLVLQDLFPYNITPVIQLLRQCESLFEGSELF